MSIYDYTVKARKGATLNLNDLKGKVLLIVNTATGCGFTPQYEALEKLYEKYHDQGFEVLDFPCNQFGHQAPGDEGEIHEFCIGRFAITFPQFSKIDVNGADAIPLYQWLTSNTKFEGFDKNPAGLALTTMLRAKDKDFKTSSDVKWNFTKFLIGRDGEIAARFEPMTNLKKVKAAVEAAL